MDTQTALASTARQTGLAGSHGASADRSCHKPLPATRSADIKIHHTCSMDVRVLHVGDASGVTMTLAKWQSRISDMDVAVTLPLTDDPVQIIPFYMGRMAGWRRHRLLPLLGRYSTGDNRAPWWRAMRAVACTIDDTFPLFQDGHSRHIAWARTYVELVARQAKGCDIVHVHGNWEWLKHLRDALPRTTLLAIHHHGDHLRLAAKADVEAAEAHADLALVSTPDLLDYGEHRTYLPNPVDTDHFSAQRRRHQPHALPRALYINKPWDHGHPRSEERIRLINKHCPHGATALDHAVPYRDMPALLCNYDTYCDVRTTMAGTIISSLSMTGLQSLATGLDVVVSDGTIYERVPPQHMPGAVAAQTHKLYRGAN